MAGEERRPTLKAGKLSKVTETPSRVQEDPHLVQCGRRTRPGKGTMHAGTLWARLPVTDPRMTVASPLPSNCGLKQEPHSTKSLGSGLL